MQPSPQLKSLVEQICEPDERATLGNLDKEKAEQVIVAIHQGGRNNVLGLIDMLVEPGAGNDIKPHFALHCLAVYVCGLEDKKHRREFAETLAGQLGGSRPKGVQKYLIEQLQVCGAEEVVGPLGKALLDEELCEPAVRALVAIGQGAAAPLRAALPNVQGNARLNVIQALGALQDAAAAEALRQALGDPDREIRLAAAWGLAKMGDVGSVDLLLQAADGNGRQRFEATDACFDLAENLLAAGHKAEALKIYTHLKKTRTDPDEQYVREAAENALAAAMP
ncbi:MAG: HEAT repeat domain-containing protein [Thermoguttaceae bacterium]